MKLTYSNSLRAPLCAAYIENGYLPTGFIGFARAMCPTATVTGSVASGVVFEFADEQEYTLFLLKWVGQYDN